jgi:hypothetical protein
VTNFLNKQKRCDEVPPGYRKYRKVDEAALRPPTEAPLKSRPALSPHHRTNPTPPLLASALSQIHDSALPAFQASYLIAYQRFLALFCP